MFQISSFLELTHVTYLSWLSRPALLESLLCIFLIFLFFLIFFFCFCHAMNQRLEGEVALSTGLDATWPWNAFGVTLFS